MAIDGLQVGVAHYVISLPEGKARDGAQRYHSQLGSLLTQSHI